MSDMDLEEQPNQIKIDKILDNAATVSNIIELATSVVINMAGKDIADSIGEQSLNRSVLSNLVANRVRDRVLGKKE